MKTLLIIACLMAGCCPQVVRELRTSEQKRIKLERIIVREQNLALEKCQDQKDLLEMGKYKSAQDSLPNELIFR